MMNISVQKFGLYLMVLTATATNPAVLGQDVSLWDVLPVTSQLKSVVQLITGDTSGAAKTQMNFLNEGLGTSQLRTAYFLVTGEPQKALDVQKKFFSNLEVLLDGAPIVGHVKGGIHLLTGNDEHGWRAIKSATSTTGTLLGGVALGPVGALAGRGLTDAIITVVDTSIHGRRMPPYGIFAYLKDMDRMSAGEHFDAIAGLALDAYTGVQGRAHLPLPPKYRIAIKGSGDPAAGARLVDRRPSAEMSATGEVNLGASLDSVFEIGEESMPPRRPQSSADIELADLRPLAGTSAIGEVNHGASLDSLFEIAGREWTPPRKPQSPAAAAADADAVQMRQQLVTKTANTVRNSAFKNFIEYDSKYSEKRLDMYTREEISKRTFDGLNAYADASVLDMLDVDAMRNRFGYLADGEKSLIAKEDFRTVNTGAIKADSTLSSIAGIVGEDVGALKSRLSEKPAKDAAGDPHLDAQPDSHFKELAKRGDIEYAVSEELNGLTELNEFIADHVDTMTSESLVLTETSAGTGQVNAYGLKVKKLDGYPDHAKVLIDYSTPAFLEKDLPNPYRVVSFVKSPENSFKVYAVRVTDKGFKSES